jgi:hypothetical protein
MSKLINKYINDDGCCSVCGSPSCSICEKYDNANCTFYIRFAGQWPPLETPEQRTELFERLKKEYGVSALIETIKHYRLDKVSTYKKEIENATK